MKIIEQSFPFLVSTVENHSFHKDQILKAISEMNMNNQISVGATQINYATTTDWNLPKNVHRPYVAHVEKIFNDHIQEVCKIFEFDKMLSVNGLWFQQYGYLNHHSWHTHPSTLFANIYYVELPENSSKTLFKIMDREFTVDVKEGDILTFPSCILHQSAPNPSTERKTIIGFNLNLVY